MQWNIHYKKEAHYCLNVFVIYPSSRRVTIFFGKQVVDSRAWSAFDNGITHSVTKARKKQIGKWTMFWIEGLPRGIILIFYFIFSLIKCDNGGPHVFIDIVNVHSFLEKNKWYNKLIDFANIVVVFSFSHF